MTMQRYLANVLAVRRSRRRPEGRSKQLKTWDVDVQLTSPLLAELSGPRERKLAGRRVTVRRDAYSGVFAQGQRIVIEEGEVPRSPPSESVGRKSRFLEVEIDPLVGGRVTRLRRRGDGFDPLCSRLVPCGDEQFMPGGLYDTLTSGKDPADDWKQRLRCRRTESGLSVWGKLGGVGVKRRVQLDPAAPILHVEMTLNTKGDAKAGRPKPLPGWVPAIALANPSEDPLDVEWPSKEGGEEGVGRFVPVPSPMPWHPFFRGPGDRIARLPANALALHRRAGGVVLLTEPGRVESVQLVAERHRCVTYVRHLEPTRATRSITYRFSVLVAERVCVTAAGLLATFPLPRRPDRLGVLCRPVSAAATAACRWSVTLGQETVSLSRHADGQGVGALFVGTLDRERVEAALGS
ncbi:MAG: hypothetical protein ACYS22_21520 [Planctomycetota bacterium]|jgi:hypothetical protein